MPFNFSRLRCRQRTTRAEPCMKTNTAAAAAAAAAEQQHRWVVLCCLSCNTARRQMPSNTHYSTDGSGSRGARMAPSSTYSYERDNGACVTGGLDSSGHWP
jgi:hypothetical protein